MTRGRLFGAIVGLALCAAGIAAWVRDAHQRNERYYSSFPLITRGALRGKVIDIMGRPSKEGACRSELVPGVPPGCADEIVYADGFAPLDPQYWVVRLDQRGKVIESTWTASP